MATPVASIANPATYPYGATNGYDIIGANGQTTLQVASVALLLAGSPGTIVTPGSTQKVVVVAMALAIAIAGTFTWQDSSGTPVILFGAATVPANSQFILPFNPAGWFATTLAGKTLNLACTGTSQVIGGSITYYLL